MLTPERTAAVVAAMLLMYFSLQSPQRQPVRIVVHHRREPTPVPPRDPQDPIFLDPPPPPPQPTGPLNLDSLLDLRAAVKLAEGRELILTTSDWHGIGSAVNLARQLGRFSLERRLLLLADVQSTCVRGRASWPWLACGFSRGIPGFEARYRSLGMPLVEMWNLWSAKWLVLARLVELGVNVMMMDSDILVLADPYTQLLSAPLSHFALVLPPEGARVNVGYVYARGATATGGLHSLLWDVVRRLRLFIEQTTLRDRLGQPSVSGLWDQGLFSDALLSAAIGASVYPFTWLHSPDAFAHGRRDGTVNSDGGAGEGTAGAIAWPPPGFTEANASRIWRQLWHTGSRGEAPPGMETRARRPPSLFPSLPPHHPQVPNWQSWQPLLWNELRLIEPTSELDPKRVVQRPDLRPGWTGGSPRWLDEVKRRSHGGETSHSGSAAAAAAAAARLGAHENALYGMSDYVVAAPDWLHCTTGHWMMTAGWLSADRPVCAVLHLVESRAQFAHFASLDTLKANRPYLMKAYGHWHAEASRLDPDQGRAPGASALRAIRLGVDVLAAAGASNGLGALLNVLQALAILATLTNRTPVIPSIPCSSRWLHRHGMTPNGIADDAVMQLPPSLVDTGMVSCHLSIGGAQCAWPMVLPGWQPLGGTARRTGQVPAARFIISSNGTGAHQMAIAADTAAAQAVALRAAAFWVQSAPMVEITVADLRALLPGTSQFSAFQCGRATPVVDEAALTEAEAHKLQALQRACPAFFAPRGTRRRRLDWLHRRRHILDSDDPACARL